jgi:NAD(P)-dependent dehydrogenase (short-subunit alcohol dehydrogenase family)
MAGRVVVVTGASAGVGRAVVREFARRGDRIGLLARGEEGLAAARREAEELGGRALALPTDVADAAAVEAAASRVEEAFGPIDVWVNNAMVSVFSPVKLLHADEVHRVTEVTYHGYVHGTLAALRRMLPRDRGVIVQVGSALAYRAIPLQAAYCAAKHAIKGFTQSLQVELRHDRSRVKVTMVDLPAVNTPQFGWVRSRLPRRPQPVPPIFQPEVPARAIAWAADHPRRRFRLGLSTVIAVYGTKLAPLLGDLYLARTGYESQQHDGAPPPDRRDNLYAPVPGDAGAHGDFDDRAKARSLQAALNRRRGALALAAAAASAGWWAAARTTRA